ncbi:hypothetical protein ABPG72_005932 [Tetrahymena utriculariae]
MIFQADSYTQISCSQIANSIITFDTTNQFYQKEQNMWDKQRGELNQSCIPQIECSLTVFEPNIEYIKQNKQIYLSSQTDQLKELVNDYLTQKWKFFLSQTITKKKKIFFAATQAFPIQSTYQVKFKNLKNVTNQYQYISLDPYKIQANAMTYNLDPFYFNYQIWVTIGVSYTQNNLGSIFLLLNTSDQNTHFCLTSANPTENQLQSMYSIAYDSNQVVQILNLYRYAIPQLVPLAKRPIDQKTLTALL